jgi:hypothetical protein
MKKMYKDMQTEELNLQLIERDLIDLKQASENGQDESD